MGGIVRTYPALFFAIMLSRLKYLTCVYVFAIIAACTSLHATEQGILEGHVKINSGREVELAGATPSKTEHNYSEYPLIILSGERKQVARVIADGNGNYRVALPPGNYVLDVEGRHRGHLRARPQPFTVTSDRTVHVDMNIDTGIR